MKDIYADTLRERVQKQVPRHLLPGWLADKFEDVADEPYALKMLTQQREWWREHNADYVLHGKRVGEFWHPPSFTKLKTPTGVVCVPQLKEPQLYGATKKKLPDEFLKAVNIATALLPDSMRMLSAEQGMGLKLGRILTDIDPEYKGKKCRGQDIMFVNTSGVFNWHDKYVAATQGYISAETGKFVEGSFDYTVDSVLHEFGHNFESFVMNTIQVSHSWLFSAEPQQRDFFRAHRLDVADLKGATSSGEYDLTYYLTKDKGGTQDHEGAACSETLAQLFAERYTNYVISLHQAFPRCAEVMDRMLASMDRMVKANPSYGHITLDRT